MTVNIPSYRPRKIIKQSNAADKRILPAALYKSRGTLSEFDGTNSKTSDRIRAESILYVQ